MLQYQGSCLLLTASGLFCHGLSSSCCCRDHGHCQLGYKRLPTKKKRVREGVGRRGCSHGGRNERTTRNSDVLWASITWWAESKWTWRFIWTSDLRSVDRDAPHSLALLAPATQRPRNILGEYFFSYLSSYLN